MLSVVGFSSLEPVPRFALNFKPGKPPRPNDGVLKYTSPRRKFVLSRTQRSPRARGCERQSKNRPRHAMRVGDAAGASAAPAHPPRTYRGDERRELPPQAEQTQTEICTCPLTRDLATLRWRPATSSPHPWHQNASGDGASSAPDTPSSYSTLRPPLPLVYFSPPHRSNFTPPLTSPALPRDPAVPTRSWQQVTRIVHAVGRTLPRHFIVLT
jgi:hypothetical protein